MKNFLFLNFGLIVFIVVFSKASFSQTQIEFETNWKEVISRISNSETPITEIYTLAELNIEAARISNLLQDCSQKINKSIEDIYSDKSLHCEQSITEGLFQLHQQFKQFMQSSLIDKPEFHLSLNQKLSNLIHPLIFQVAIENLSTQKIFTQKTVWNWNTICQYIPVLRHEDYCFQMNSAPELREIDLKTLRLFSYFSTEQCNWGLWPQSTVAMFIKIQDAQGFTTLGNNPINDYEMKVQNKKLKQSEINKNIHDAYSKFNPFKCNNNFNIFSEDIYLTILKMQELYHLYSNLQEGQ